MKPWKSQWILLSTSENTKTYEQKVFKVWWPKSPKKIDILIVIHCLLLIIFGIFTEVRGLWPAPTPCPGFWHCNSMTSRIPPASAPCTASSHMPHSWPNSSQAAEKNTSISKMGSCPHAVRAMVVRITPWQTYSRNRRAARRKADGRAQSVTTSEDVVKATRRKATNTATNANDHAITLMEIQSTSRMSMTNGWFGREEGSACCSLSSAACSRFLLRNFVSMIHSYHSWRASIHIQDTGCCKRRSTAKTVATATPGPLADGEKFTAKAMQRKVQVELRYAKAATLPIYSILMGESGLSSFK